MTLRPFILVAVLVQLSPCSWAHTLQNFTQLDVKRKVTITSSALALQYDCAFLPGVLQSPDKILDTNEDGKFSPEEKSRFLRESNDYLTSDIFVMQNQAALELVPLDFLHLSDGNGFKTEIRAQLIPSDSSNSPQQLQIVDPAYLMMPAGGQMTPTEILAGRGIVLFDDQKNTTGLTTQVASGPHATVRFQRNSAQMSGPDDIGFVARPSTKNLGDNSLQTPGANRLREMVKNSDASTFGAIMFLFVAAWLGALHALTPGHGKAIVGAYLVGSRGRIRDAVYLGTIVTITHTSSVILLGLIALFAKQYVTFEALNFWLPLVSGMLIFVFGAGLFVTRIRGKGLANHSPDQHHSHGSPHSADHSHEEHKTNSNSECHAQPTPGEHTHTVAAGGEIHEHHLHEHVHTGVAGGDLVHKHPHLHLGHAHTPADATEHIHTHNVMEHHEHEFGGGADLHSHTADEPDRTHGSGGHSHSHGEHVHSHGGRSHSHDIPDHLTLRGLLALGISGGIVPCPDAMVVLLLAVAVNKIGFGLALIIAFSLGLAGVLVGIGILMVSARPLMERISGGASSKLATFWLPVGSAFIVMLLGLGLTLKLLVDAKVLVINV